MDYQIDSFHTHVYFDADTVDQARDLCERARDEFGVALGRIHEKPVGPHPMWSCQLTVQPEDFGSVVPWIALNRDGLIIFIHANTGYDLADHTRHAIWMGEKMDLGLSIFSDEGASIVDGTIDETL
jgi:aromatic ring-cleaving dioxygenase